MKAECDQCFGDATFRVTIQSGRDHYVCDDHAAWALHRNDYDPDDCYVQNMEKV